jgi:hypothetical protein
VIWTLLIPKALGHKHNTET